MMTLTVKKWRTGYAVFDGAKRVSCVYSGHLLASSQKDRIEARALEESRAMHRPCLRCGGRFRSTGPGHRMCDRCRGHGLGAEMLG